jgi:hypothetical protein
MSVIYRRDVIRDVLRRYTDQYANYADDYMIGDSRTRQAVGDTKKALAALNLDTCSVSDVDAAMNGTTGWADLNCDECGESVPILVRIGQEPDYEARWWDVCESCLRKSLALLVSSPPKP